MSMEGNVETILVHEMDGGTVNKNSYNDDDWLCYNMSSYGFPHILLQLSLNVFYPPPPPLIRTPFSIPPPPRYCLIIAFLLSNQALKMFTTVPKIGYIFCCLTHEIVLSQVGYPYVFKSICPHIKSNMTSWDCSFTSRLPICLQINMSSHQV